ncbi:hypothetical protein SAMN05660690_4152 [Geodermatophilus telluris]|uniref:Uncharacterized protein n=1 Tax=Geodermatophilus telluris TaxID=1190417 RepID=A0A1G6UBU1_9ACTN|nr:hypothetical protein [Geodermatophilus telluris]SDD38714.1 hypothetical protein SAMN05660690_4152 [Geodermatophilus telluris]
MTATPPAGPRTQEIPLVPPGATAAGAAEQHPAPVPDAAAHAAPPLPPPAPGAGSTAVQPRVEDPAPYGSGLQPTGPLDAFFGPAPVPHPAPAEAGPAAPHAPHGTSGPHDAPARPATPAAKRARTPRTRTPQDRALLTGAGLVALALVLLELGLALRWGGDRLWAETPLWSAFATLAVLAGALPFVSRLRLPGGAATAERAALGGLAGLGVFWLLVALPDADTDRGFLLTAALAALGLAQWLVPGRRR